LHKNTKNVANSAGQRPAQQRAHQKWDKTQAPIAFRLGDAKKMRLVHTCQRNGSDGELKRLESERKVQMNSMA
jgi:hypothetical protein